MKASELRKKSGQDLQKQLMDLRKEQFSLRVQKATGQTGGGHQFRRLRQDIARVKTILHEKKQPVDA